MTRKFRVWHKGLKRYLTKDEWFIDLDGKLRFYLFKVLTFVQEGSYSIQQYIGVNDFSNKEIYEGDIIEFEYETGPGEIEKETGEVFFEEGCFYFSRKSKFATNDCNFLTKTLKVIGNINL